MRELISKAQSDRQLVENELQAARQSLDEARSETAVQSDIASRTAATLQAVQDQLGQVQRELAKSSATSAKLEAEVAAAHAAYERLQAELKSETKQRDERIHTLTTERNKLKREGDDLKARLDTAAGKGAAAGTASAGVAAEVPASPEEWFRQKQELLRKLQRVETGKRR